MASKSSPHKPWGKVKKQLEQQALAESDEHYISKSQAKRNVEELQKLGLTLLKLSKHALEQLNLDEKLFDALLLAQNIKSNSGYRRQVQLIGKLMRHTDADAIRLRLKRYQHPIEEANTHFHTLEKWRDRLLHEGDNAINDLMNQYPDMERSRLRQFVRNAKKEQEQNKTPKNARLLFKYLKESVPE